MDCIVRVLLCAVAVCCSVCAEEDVANRKETLALLKNEPVKSYDLKDAAGSTFTLTERRDESWVLYTLADKDGKQSKSILARIIPLPAIYKNEEYKILVKEASGNAPAVYETRSRVVCVKPPSTTYDYSSHMSLDEEQKKVTVGATVYTVEKVNELSGGRQRLRKKAAE